MRRATLVVACALAVMMSGPSHAVSTPGGCASKRVAPASPQSNGCQFSLIGNHIKIAGVSAPRIDGATVSTEVMTLDVVLASDRNVRLGGCSASTIVGACAAHIGTTFPPGTEVLCLVRSKGYATAACVSNP